MAQTIKLLKKRHRWDKRSKRRYDSETSQHADEMTSISDPEDADDPSSQEKNGRGATKRIKKQINENHLACDNTQNESMITMNNCKEEETSVCE